MKLLIFTSTRADSGIMAPMARELSNRGEFEVHALVSGAHLSCNFGHTLEQELSAWGPVVVHEVPINQSEFSEVGTSRALGYLQVALSDVMFDLKPDLALVLGDRSEAVIFAFTCSLLGIPIAHFHGGEVSFGALDELHRHAITKLSSLHFPAAELSVKRIVQMGEQPSSVFFFGPLVSDRISSGGSVSKEFLAETFSFKWGENTALVTVHGAKFDNPSTAEHLTALLEACDKVEDLNVIFTGPNADPESQALRNAIVQYCLVNPSRAFFVESFGSESYLEMLKTCNVAIGNSSSLVHEASFTGIPIIALGCRQEGRSSSTPSGVGPDPILIELRIREALDSPRGSKGNMPSTFNVSEKIASAISLALPVNRKKIFWSEND